MVKHLCEPCTDVNSSPVTVFLLFGMPCLALGVAYMRRRRRSQAGSPADSMQVQLTDNPLQSTTLQSLSLQSTMERGDDAYVLARCVWQPARILIGYGQIVNQVTPFIAHGEFCIVVIALISLLRATDFRRSCHRVSTNGAGSIQPAFARRCQPQVASPDYVSH